MMHAAHITQYRGDPSPAHVYAIYGAAVSQSEYAHLDNCVLLLLPVPCRED